MDGSCPDSSLYLKMFDIEKETAIHAFRHALSTSLAESRVPASIIALIMGHARKQEAPVLEIHCIHIANVKRLCERVEVMAKYRPTVSLTEYRRGQFAHAFELSLHA